VRGARARRSARDSGSRHAHVRCGAHAAPRRAPPQVIGNKWDTYLDLLQADYSEWCAPPQTRARRTRRSPSAAPRAAARARARRTARNARVRARVVAAARRGALRASR
jgi:hypothetical protein